MFHIDRDLVFLFHDIIQAVCPQNNDPFLDTDLAFLLHIIQTACPQNNHPFLKS